MRRVPRTLTRIDDEGAKTRGKLCVRWEIECSGASGASGVVGAGNERDYIVLTRIDTPTVDVHLYSDMEWVDGKASGRLELPLPKETSKNATSDQHSSDDMFEFRYVAEAVAWGIRRDVVVARSEPFNPFEAVAVSVPVAPNQTLLLPFAPPVDLKYLLEKRMNISCFQLFVHRPVESVGAVPRGTPRPPIPSPTHVRLQLDARHAPELICNRKSLKLTFTARGALHSLDISFADCEIDPRKCTVHAEERHWSMRLPFYFGGSESKQREVGVWKRPQAVELNRDCMLNMACAFCEGPIIDSSRGSSALARVSEAPSAYWAELSDFWFCLRGDAETRLQELKGGRLEAGDDSMASGGAADVPLRENSVVVGKADIVLRWEDVDLGLDNSLMLVDVGGRRTATALISKPAAAAAAAAAAAEEEEDCEGGRRRQWLNKPRCVEGDACGDFLTSIGANTSELPVAGVVLCKRCRAPMGTSHARSDKTTAIRLWKWRMTSVAEDGCELLGGEIYTAESVIGNAVLDALERKGGRGRTFLVEGFEIVSSAFGNGMEGVVVGKGSGAVLTVLSAEEEVKWGGGEEGFGPRKTPGSLRPVIRVLWELVQVEAYVKSIAEGKLRLNLKEFW